MTLVSIKDERIALAIAERNAMLEQKLRELGPGWAIGYRLKEAEFDARGPSWPEPMTVDLVWETHVVELVDGQLSAGHADFQYVTLKEDDHAPR